MPKRNTVKLMAACLCILAPAMSFAAGSGRFGPKDGKGIQTDVKVGPAFKEAAKSEVKASPSPPAGGGTSGSGRAGGGSPMAGMPAPKFKPPG